MLYILFATFAFLCMTIFWDTSIWLSFRLFLPTSLYTTLSLVIIWPQIATQMVLNIWIIIDPHYILLKQLTKRPKMFMFCWYSFCFFLWILPNLTTIKDKLYKEELTNHKENMTKFSKVKCLEENLLRQVVGITMEWLQ